MIVFAQGPEITSWILNLNGATNPSYPNELTNVQNVCYTSTDVYVSCTCIPGYDIGPWSQNPNQPANQNFVFKINLIPQENTGNKTKAPMGHTGVWSNGVSIFNAEDGMSYNNQGVWNQNALSFIMYCNPTTMIFKKQSKTTKELYTYKFVKFKNS